MALCGRQLHAGISTRLVAVEEDVALRLAELLKVHGAARHAVLLGAGAPRAELLDGVRVEAGSALAVPLLVVDVPVEGGAEPVDGRAHDGDQLDA